MTVLEAIGRLKAAKLLDPTNLWNRVHLGRRSAVLALLYRDSNAELSCMVTVRSAGISYSGDAALPGGKADSEDESSFHVATREAWEEVGLPLDSPIEHIKTMPAYLSSRYLMVVPEIAWLPPEHTVINRNTNLPMLIDPGHQSPEVKIVFSAPVRKFLDRHQYHSADENWFGMKFKQHYFEMLSPKKRIGDPAMIKVWGLTANILIDIARLAFDREPSFPHRVKGQYGDQQLLQALADKGFFDTRERPKFINFRKVVPDSLDYRLWN